MVVRWGLPDGRTERITVQYDFGSSSRQAAHFVRADDSDQVEGYLSTNQMRAMDDNRLGLLGLAVHHHRRDKGPMLLKHQALIVLATRPVNAVTSTLCTRLGEQALTYLKDTVTTPPTLHPWDVESHNLSCQHNRFCLPRGIHGLHRS